MAEPFISPLGFTITPALSAEANQRRRDRRKKRCTDGKRMGVRSRSCPSAASPQQTAAENKEHGKQAQKTTPPPTSSTSSDGADNVPSKYRKTPSLRRHAFFWRITTAGITFFRSSGFPFLTVASTMSPTDADGRRLSTPLMPLTEMMYRFLAPVLSAQLITAPTGRERVVRNLLPEAPPRPTHSDHIHMTANQKREQQEPARRKSCRQDTQVCDGQGNR